ncbi:hypothetical protein BS50DRAFT_618024 [Corynespora cassiicola Philippines]|uniref:F-box domain-containing protein n=1 Tax=Corynespora cassiicola Philippines TaxID=1448308 RepID=A0A2T2NZH4_CORCC|nr:hypothetical protein BS50DRAFT_618024 [Corynespora cassiicola Philippines]
MLYLLELPEDILRCIIEMFQDLASLGALFSAYPYLSQFTPTRFLKHLEGLKNEDTGHMARIFYMSPSLRDLVRSCRPIMIQHDSTVAIDSLREALSYPNLESLCVSRDFQLLRMDLKFQPRSAMDVIRWYMQGRSTRKADFECSFIDEHDFSNINNIKLVPGQQSGHSVPLGSDFSSTEIVRFALLPGVRSVEATGLAKLTPALLPSGTVSSQITSLQLLGGRYWNVTPDALRSILSYTPSLVNLHCQIPIKTQAKPIPEPTEVEGPVRPSDIQAALLPVMRGLRKLTLVENRYFGISYDGSRLDLSEFPSLAHIRVPSCCILPAGGPCEAREHSYLCLPPTISELHLDFPRTSGIFYYHGDRDRSFIRQTPNDIPPRRWAWLRQFAWNKRTRFPDLKHIRMVDPVGDTGFRKWLKWRWSPPQEISERYSYEDIELNIEIRFPDPRGEPNWVVRGGE